MYSIVLATMLTAGGAAPDFGHGCWGCHGCHGCHGCYGCCGGCWGCCGGCYGCCGGCYGCYGCCGGCWGCYGCCGGCWGVSYYSGCYGCCGGCYGCYGCWGGCYGYGVVAAPVVAVPVAQAVQTLPAAPQKTAASNTANVVLKAPTDVRLSVEGRVITRTAAEETFRTPVLEAGQSYTYTFKAEVAREGKTVAYTKQVKVRAGQTSEADFTQLATVGKDVARVTVKLPADARLYVDNVLCTLTSATRSFNTPELEAGRPYYYTLKAEFAHDGQTRTATRRVTVEAGKQVTVEFKDAPVQAVSH